MVVNSQLRNYTTPNELPTPNFQLPTSKTPNCQNAQLPKRPTTQFPTARSPRGISWTSWELEVETWEFIGSWALRRCGVDTRLASARYTSHSATASRSDVRGSRVGPNSCAM